MVFSLGFHGINHEPYPQLDPNEGQCHNVFMGTMTVTVLDLGVFSEPIGVIIGLPHCFLATSKFRGKKKSKFRF